MSIVNVKKAQLQKNGYKDFNEWIKHPNHIYIGRDMSFYVPGTIASKWHNPFTIEKYGLNTCLEMYETYIRNSILYNHLDELRGKELGCWCYPDKCHGDVLLRLLAEKDSNR